LSSPAVKDLPSISELNPCFDNENNWCYVNGVISGLYKSPSRLANHPDWRFSCNKLHCLERARYLASIQIFGKCIDKVNNWNIERPGWSTCPKGQAIHGLYKGDCDQLYCLEHASCCEAVTDECYEQDMRGTFNKENNDHSGWVDCKPGYAINGFYNSGTEGPEHGIHQLEFMRCCRFKETSYTLPVLGQRTKIFELKDLQIDPQFQFGTAKVYGWCVGKKTSDKNECSLLESEFECNNYKVNNGLDGICKFEKADLGNYRLALPFQGGFASDCTNLGCTTEHGGLLACTALCDRTEGCNVFNFAPKDATATSGLNRCCRRKCTSTRNNDLKLTEKWKGWDVYVKTSVPEKKFAVVPESITDCYKPQICPGRSMSVEFELGLTGLWQIDVRGAGSHHRADSIWLYKNEENLTPVSSCRVGFSIHVTENLKWFSGNCNGPIYLSGMKGDRVKITISTREAGTKISAIRFTSKALPTRVDYFPLGQFCEELPDTPKGICNVFETKSRCNNFVINGLKCKWTGKDEVATRLAVLNEKVSKHPSLFYSTSVVFVLLFTFSIGVFLYSRSSKRSDELYLQLVEDVENEI